MSFDLLLRIVLSIIIGFAIGLERELHEKPAGLRTMILICAGACLFTIISVLMVGQNVDNTRIAAQIITGVGFLGAGTVLRDKKGGVKGLTTAASIWMSSALGMSCGFGLFSLALTGALFTVGVLLFLNPHRWSKNHKKQ